MSTKDEIARLRAEAAHFRALAKGKRKLESDAKTAGDWLGKLNADIQATGYVRDAQGRDKRIKDLRARP